MKEPKLTKRERVALEEMRDGSIVVSTSSVYDGLRHCGLVESMGLRLASRGRTGSTFKSSFRITAAGRAALAATNKEPKP